MPRTPQDIPLTDEQRDLAATCYDLVYYLTNEARIPSFLDREEASSVAMFALLDAARLYDPSHGVRFSTYAGVAIRRRLWTYVKSEGAKVYRERAMGQSGCDEYVTGYEEYDLLNSGGLVDVQSREPAPDAGLMKEDEARELRTLLRKIEQSASAQDWSIVRLRAMGLTFRQVAQRCRCNKETARKRMHFLYKRLRDAGLVRHADTNDDRCDWRRRRNRTTACSDT